MNSSTHIKSYKPKQAWDFLSKNHNAVLIDVRTKVEYTHVGHPTGAVHILWKEAPDWKINPHFVNQVSEQVSEKTTPILLICRSGQRSMDAAKVLEAAGYTHLINVEEGFEGPLDDNKHRGTVGGWRFAELPWEQS